MKAKKAADWLALGEASRRLGVDPDTLRRWADAGKIEVFVTPGGHRRFPRAAVDALLPHPPSAPRSLEGVGAVDRIAADLGRRLRAELGATRWTRSLGADDRVSFRERGRLASTTLLRYLNAARRGERERLLFEIEDLGRAYGREAKTNGMSLARATEALLFVRGQFTAQLAGVMRRRGLPAARTLVLLEEADRAFDHMLLALIEAHQRR
ncbi:MAG: helix-turn-helix domain-containing protein [Chloroflexi bacterium]|nr:MAG: helix-turn-helix domain-containing protein [Chloroflexota bacterium]